MSIADQILQLEEELELFRSGEIYTELQERINELENKLDDTEYELKEIREAIETFTHKMKYI